MATRDYEGAGIIVHWDSDRCIHSERCTKGLPIVFDRSRRPWVKVDGASADDVASVIDTCPSGALSYTRTDGAPNGRRGRALDEDPARSIRADAVEVGDATGGSIEPTAVTITPQRDGPLHVAGRVAITLADGTVRFSEHLTLCRCGHSQSKPHCDGSHARVGFKAPGVAFE